MNEEMIELAYIRNHLACNNFSEEDKKLLNEVKQKIIKLNTPFTEVALNAIKNCENDIENKDYKSAAQEIHLIHNFTFNNVTSWNSDYFYKIELLSYIELNNDIQRLKRLFISLGKLQYFLGIE